MEMMRTRINGGHKPRPPKRSTEAPMKDLTVIMEDRPGKLADLGEATGRAGVNIDGLCAMVGDGKGFIHILVQDEERAKTALAEAGIDVADEQEAVIVDLHDKPGAMGEIARDLAEAGVSVDVAYTIFSGVRLVIVTEDVEAARGALELNGAAA
jgi:hypothetical protein